MKEAQHDQRDVHDQKHEPLWPAREMIDDDGQAAQAPGRDVEWNLEEAVSQGCEQGPEDDEALMGQEPTRAENQEFPQGTGEWRVVGTEFHECCTADKAFLASGVVN
mgnify:FL=1